MPLVNGVWVFPPIESSHPFFVVTPSTALHWKVKQYKIIAPTAGLTGKQFYENSDVLLEGKSQRSRLLIKFLLWYLIELATDKAGYGSPNTTEGWYSYLVSRKIMPDPSKKYEYRDYINYLEYLTEGMLTGSPDKDIEAFTRNPSNEKLLGNKIWEGILKVTKVSATAAGLSFLSDNIDKVLPDGAIKDALTDLTSGLTDTDNLIKLAGEIVADTLKDFLNTQRSELMQYIEQADDKTFLNLSSLTDTLSNNTAKVVKDLTAAMQDSTEDILKTIVTTVKGIDRALEYPESNEHQVYMDLQHEIGEGMVSAIDRWIFIRKKKL